MSKWTWQGEEADSADEMARVIASYIHEEARQIDPIVAPDGSLHVAAVYANVTIHQAVAAPVRPLGAVPVQMGNWDRSDGEAHR